MCLISGNFFNEGTINNPDIGGGTYGVFGIVSSGDNRAIHLAGNTGAYIGQLTLSGASDMQLTANSYFPALRVEGPDTIYLGDYVLRADQFNFHTPKIITNGSGGITQLVGATPVVFDIGTDKNSNTPVIISNHGIQDYFTVSVKNGVYQNGNSGDTIKQEAVNKTWNIEEQTAGGSNADITLQWNASDELPLFNRNNIYLAHYINGAWDNGSLTLASGNNPYTVTRTGITSFSPFTVASSPTILPVHFVSVNASLFNKDAIVTWKVANESNVDYYNIQRSINAKDFTTVGKLLKISNSASLHSYNYTDFNAANINTKNIYYRLQQADKDGKQNLSEIVSVNLTAKNNVLSIWPTPVKNVLHISVNNSQDGKAVIYNINGKQIMQQEIKAGNIAEFNLNNISAGTYFIKVYLKDGMLQGKFIKN